MTEAPSHEPGEQCRSCPWCVLLRTLRELRPEVGAHLAAAGRELALAVRAVMADGAGFSDDVAGTDGGGAGHPDVAGAAHGDDGRLRRIDIR